jgi:hypothetical protein
MPERRSRPRVRGVRDPRKATGVSNRPLREEIEEQSHVRPEGQAADVARAREERTATRRPRKSGTRAR